MRIIVDFGRDEPLIGLNSSGQSGNPASPHYADGIEAWRQGDYQSFPFKAENLERVYGIERLSLVPAGS
ncbi:Acyl-homoserine lactone acylase QuiP precursor [compost metagenome]